MTKEEKSVLISLSIGLLSFIIIIVITIFTKVGREENYILIHAILIMIVCFFLFIGGPGVYYLEKLKEQKNKR